MRICIQTLYTQDWLPIARLTTPNTVDYCRRHGYSWNIQCISSPYDAYEKISQIISVFENNEADAVVSLDCDAIITNHLKKIKDLIDGDFIVSKDYNGINCGVFIVRNSDWSIEFLRSVLDKKGQPMMHCEQDAICSYLDDIGWPEDKVKVIPQNKINSYVYELYPEIPPQKHENGNWEMGDLLIHFPGLSQEKRLQLISNTPIIK